MGWVFKRSGDWRLGIDKNKETVSPLTVVHGCGGTGAEGQLAVARGLGVAACRKGTIAVAVPFKSGVKLEGVGGTKTL